jgi:hypothetical protein
MHHSVNGVYQHTVITLSAVINSPTGNSAIRIFKISYPADGTLTAYLVAQSESINKWKPNPLDPNSNGGGASKLAVRSHSDSTSADAQIIG